MLALLIELLVLVCVFGIVWWILTLIPLPPPIRTVVLVIMGIIAIVILLGFVGWLPLGIRHLRL